MGQIVEKRELTSQIADIFRRLNILETQTRKNFGNITIDGNAGELIIRDNNSNEAIKIDGTGTLRAYNGGQLIIEDTSGNEAIKIDDTGTIRAYNGGQILVEDTTGTARILIDGTGTIKVSQSGTDVTTATNAQLTFLSTYRQLRESTIHTSGGNTFTNVAPHVAINDFLTKVDFGDWSDMDWFFEASFKAGTGTASVQLYSITDAAVVNNSTVTTTSTSYVSVRSSALSKPTGVKTFVVRFGHTPSGGAGDYINLTIARHIFRRPV